MSKAWKPWRRNRSLPPWKKGGLNGYVATAHDIERLRLELEAKMEAMKADVIKWNTGTLLAATGIFAVIVKMIG